MGKRIRAVSLIIFILFLSLAVLLLSSCTNEQAKTEKPRFEGEVKEAVDYLTGEGLQPLEVISERTAKIITWEDLCQADDIIAVDAFLNKAISEISTGNGYGDVALDSIILLLEDKTTAAEVYFHNGEIIGGLTYKYEDNLHPKQYRSLQGETLEEILHMDYPVWKGQQVDNPSVYLIELKNAFRDGYSIVSKVIAVNQGISLVLCRNEIESRVYICDLNSGTDYYSGISLENHYSIKARELDNELIALILPDRIVMLDNDNFGIVEEIHFPDNFFSQADDLDISPDGKMIAYAVTEGLYVCDSDFSNSKLLVESLIGQDPYGLDWEVPRYPLFSPDSGQVLYRMVGYEWPIGTGVISVDGTDNRFFESGTEERVYTLWYDDNFIYSSAPCYSDKDRPCLLDINTGEKIDLMRDVPEDKTAFYYPGKDGKLFYWEADLEKSLQKFGIYDIINQSFHNMLEIPALYLESCFYDNATNTAMFTASNYPVKSKLFIMAGLAAK